MFSRRSCLTWFAGLLLAVSATTALADGYSSPRQYYSGWNKSPTQTYYYRYYYYKPSASYAGYKHHYVIYFPSRPKYVYYYNPY